DLHGNYGIAEYQEIRPAADPIDGIRRLRITRVEMRSGRGGKVSAGRESHHAYPIGRNVPFLRLRANHPDSPLSVAEFDRVMIARPKPVLQNKGRDAQRVEPVSLLDALVADGQSLVG